MTPTVRCIPLLALAAALAACGGGGGQPDGARADEQGRLRYGEITFEP